MGKMSRDKGAKGEREIAKILREQYGYNVKRGYVAARQQDVYGLVGAHLEIKVCRHIDVTGWLTQSIISSEKRRDGLPVVMFKQQSKEHRGLPWLVVMRYQDWASIGGEEYGTINDNHKGCFKKGIYDAMKQAAESGAETMRFWRMGYEICCMYLKDWVDMYGAWKLPFTEGEDE